MDQRDGRRARGARTRDEILRTAASLASVDGLEGLSIGRLAEATGLSKSGLFAHFGSKRELQLATVEEALRVFTQEVVRPTAQLPAGARRLHARCESWLDYCEREVFPGGCCFAATSVEFDSRPGEIRDRLARATAEWIGLLERDIAQAIRAGDLRADASAAQVAFEINALGMTANWQYQLSRDPSVFAYARAGFARALTCE
jgi:AcrR family transcriptional regulator